MASFTKSIDELKAVFAKEKEEILRDYFTFLRFKSLSADPAFRKDLEACCSWLEHYLQKCQLKVEKWEKKGGAPILFAESKHPDPQKETILLYNHYDVQPVDPIDLWTSPPFEPTVREGEVYARGASDNKGQCFYTIRALKTLLESNDPPAVNIKFLIEGEEEFGSGTLFSLLEEKKERLKADHILIIDSHILAKDRPAITLGARGLVAMTVTLSEASFDLHSGVCGGIVFNPNRALVELLASTHDKDNRVTIPHFYDDIVPISDAEKKLYDLSFDVHGFKEKFGAQPIGVEKGYSPAEAVAFRPTLEINGLAGGYGGAGFKTVIPAQAVAKISCRLVPDQSPEKIGNLVKEYLIAHTPKGISIDVEIHPGKGAGLRTKADSKIAAVMSEAYVEVFQKECARIILGASVPIAAELQRVAGADLILVGVGLSDDRIHSPNEHFGIDRLELGFLTISRVLESLRKS